MPVFEHLKSAGFLLIATTNQPGLSLETLSRRELDRMHEKLRRCFPLDDILVCPHAQMDDCPCRKPAPRAVYRSRLQMAGGLGSLIL